MSQAKPKRGAQLLKRCCANPDGMPLPSCTNPLYGFPEFGMMALFVNPDCVLIATAWAGLYSVGSQ